MKQVICALALTVAFTSIATGQVSQTTQKHKDSMKAEMSLYPAAETKWKDGPASLPAGSKFAVLEGDPAKEGFFTMRLWLPDGFKIPAHWHPKVEHVTVISGTFNVGMGDKFDQAATRAMLAGAFGFWPADMKHFAWAKGDTVLQLHGTGPWMITYVNPADDPRKPK
ncbi:MAG: cupin domain-containing protein [Pyrinomonadaceae bacterium]